VWRCRLGSRATAGNHPGDAMTESRSTGSSSRVPIGRAAAAVVAVLGGVALLVYGAAFHVETVVIEREKQVQVEAPPENGIPSFLEPATDTITIKEFVDVDRSEPYLMRVAALGGLDLLPSGRIIESEVASACPT